MYNALVTLLSSKLLPIEFTTYTTNNIRAFRPLGPSTNLRMKTTELGVVWCISGISLWRSFSSFLPFRYLSLQSIIITSFGPSFERALSLSCHLFLLFARLTGGGLVLVPYGDGHLLLRLHLRRHGHWFGSWGEFR